MAKTAIEWTTDVWNPTTGCDRVSPGCDHCYAMTLAKRLKGMGSAKYQNDGDPRTSGPGFGLAVHPGSLDLPLKWRKPRRIFVNSMSDLFHDKVSSEFIARVFVVMALAERHTFQVLTKRHGRMRSLLSDHQRWNALLSEALSWVLDHADATIPATDVDRVDRWLRDRELRTDPLPPLRNVWVGVSVEDQQRADLRIPALLDTPAAVRWLSCEPLLGPVDLGIATTPFDPAGIDWVVAGGESGHGARPMHPDWARSLRDQCVQAEIPYLFKQWGEWGPAPWSVRVCDPAVGWQGTDEELAAAKTDAERRGATHLIQPWGHVYEPNHKPWSLERDADGDYPGAIRRWGKKAAGRELDGRTWDEYPTAVTA